MMDILKALWNQRDENNNNNNNTANSEIIIFYEDFLQKFLPHLFF